MKKMEIKRIFKSCGMLLFGAAILTGCSEEETFDIDGSPANMVYLNPTFNKDATCQVMRTPAGVFGLVTTDLTVSTQYNTTDSIRLSAAVKADNEAVARYNEANGTDYVLPSADALAAMKITPSGIGVGKSKTEKPVTVFMPADKLAALTAPTYVIPVEVVLEGVDGNKGVRMVETSKANSTSYIIVNTSDVEDFTSVTGSADIGCSIVHTPVGTFGSVSTSISFNNLCAVTGDMQATLTLDNSLVDAYNESHQTGYKPLPAEFMSCLSITPGTIKEGDTNSSEPIQLSLSSDVYEKITESYLLPLRMKTSFANGTVYNENDVVYVRIDVKHSLINEKPSAILGTLQYNPGNVWKCLSAVNLDPEAMNPSSWRPTATRIDNMEAVIDLGAEHMVGSFAFRCYVMTNAHIYVSQDLESWLDVGETQGNGYIRGSQGESIYVLYGAVPVRYVKMLITCNPSSWYWYYPQYGSCDLRFFYAYTD